MFPVHKYKSALIMKEHDNVDINGVILEPKHNQELIRDCSKS